MVDLPAPEGPTIEISEPLSISKSAVNLKPPKSTNKFNLKHIVFQYYQIDKNKRKHSIINSTEPLNA